ncbi:hypothetical protein N22_049 [Idiomarinaceae phage 1N2-2]|uniref:hypothetical protein n=1 Tax=Idiomarinaceae phage 1N2-2 TaxID=1536592 RepID=UPI0004F7066F|nr:hypothetical protein N22_049 [Idiomarinaceae phage 1N2-2]AIM40751.1 hypothetical protein N22_049 [Idiomarinaceae phage 1N2-2]
MKAIQTFYKGYKFRSRLEARWAVFFDAMGFEWEYEPEGFDLGGGVYYLPDFLITKSCPYTGGSYYVEVKGGLKNGSQISDEDKVKVISLACQTDKDGVIVLGDIPPQGLEHAFFTAMSDNKDIRRVHFSLNFWGRYTVLDEVPIDLWRFCKVPSEISTVGSSYPIKIISRERMVDITISNIFVETYAYLTNVGQAYTKARQARFEHGETPR